MPEKKETVCAVVVTYNRKKLLLECLESLRRQTHCLDAICLVDNASDDGTPFVLKDNGYIKEILESKDSPLEQEPALDMLSESNSCQAIKIHYIRMHKNTGGSGGFYEGLKRGFEKGYDWLWVMDDDSKATENALEILLKYKNISKCIYPRRSFLNGRPLNWPGKINPKTGAKVSYSEKSFKDNQDYLPANLGCFEGALIHREIVAKIGFPDERFFLSGDDIVYGFSASLFTKPIYIKEICFVHLRDPKVKKKFGIRRNRESDTTLYYIIRNKFLIEECIQKLLPYRINHKPGICIGVLRTLIGVLVFDENKIKRIKIIFKALIDGYRLSKSAPTKGCTHG